MNGFIETREIYIKIGVFNKKEADKSNSYRIKVVKFVAWPQRHALNIIRSQVHCKFKHTKIKYPFIHKHAK